MSDDERVPMPREEWVRKLVHIPGGVAPFLSILLVGWAGSVSILVFILGYALVGAWAERRGRLLPIVGALIRRTRRIHEGAPVAPLEYLFAILVVGILLPETLFLPAIAVLGIGDGVAALVGIRWGRHRLPWNTRKSREGLVAGTAAAMAAAGLFAWIGFLSQSHDWARQPLLPGPTIVYVTAILVMGFPLTLVGLGYILRRHRWRSEWNAPPTLTVSVVLLLWGVSISLFLLLPGGAQQALLAPYLQPPSRTILIVLATSLALPVMFVESILRAHDNLWLPGLHAALCAAAWRYSW